MSRKLTRRAMLMRTGALATTATLSLSTRSQPASAPEIAPLLAARLKHQGVGLVAAHVSGKRVELASAGTMHSGQVAPLPQDALFEIGSITKTFTALLLADAVLRGQLKLDDAVEDALPHGLHLRDVEDRPIRWVDLATHRSGLPRLPDNLSPPDPNDPYAAYGDRELEAFILSFKPTVARNSRYEYSNLGFGLLGYALARASKQTYAQLLQTRALQPLALNDAWLALTDKPMPRLAGAHNAQGVPVAHWHFDALAPAGALVMSAASLARYAQAALGVFEHPLHEAFALTMQAHAAGPGPQNPIGLAWLRALHNGRTVLNHDGGTGGFSSSLWLDPAARSAALILANAQVEVNDLALHLLDPSVPPKDFSLTEQPALALDAKQLEPLAGVYALNSEFKLTVSLRDNQLWAQATGQGAFQLFAKSPRRFFARITPLEIEFEASESAPPGLRLEQGGQTLSFRREP